MGITVRSTAFRRGTISNTVRYLSDECATGTLCLSFGSFIPDVFMYFVNGKIDAAEFGDVKGESVLDLLMCQEYALKELNFMPGRQANYEEATLIKTKDVTELLAKTSTNVASCEARPFIYGLLQIDLDGQQVDSLLHLLFAFDRHKAPFETVQLGNTDYEAPLPQCALIRGAMKRELLRYKHDLVPLEAFKDYLQELQEQMTADESENLKGYLQSLLPHPAATHMPIERFYAFASAWESIAYRRGPDAGDNARKILHEIIRKYRTK